MCIRRTCVWLTAVVGGLVAIVYSIMVMVSERQYGQQCIYVGRVGSGFLINQFICQESGRFRTIGCNCSAIAR